MSVNAKEFLFRLVIIWGSIWITPLVLAMDGVKIEQSFIDFTIFMGGTMTLAALVGWHRANEADKYVDIRMSIEDAVYWSAVGEIAVYDESEESKKYNDASKRFYRSINNALGKK